MGGKTAVVFDFDGTLVESSERTFRISNEFLVEKGYPSVDFKKARESNVSDLFKSLKIPKWKLAIYFFIVRRRLLKLQPPPAKRGMLELLNRLNKYDVGIVTTNSPRLVAASLAYSFDFVYKRNITGKANLLKKLKKKYDRFVYVGDEVRDVIDCEKADVPFIAVTWGFNSKKALRKHKPDRVVETVDELAKMISEVLDEQEESI